MQKTSEIVKILNIDIDTAVLCSEIIMNLNKSYSVSIEGEIIKNQFKLIDNNNKQSNFLSINIGGSISKCSLLFKRVVTRYQTGRRGGSGYNFDDRVYLFGHIKLNKYYFPSLFRPENIEDKISNIFNSVEVKIENQPKLNRKYFVLAKDENNLKQNLTKEFYEYLENLNSLRIEFYENECIFMISDILNIENANEICRIGLDLDNILNN